MARFILFQEAIKESKLSRRRRRQREREQMSLDLMTDEHFIGDYRLNKKLFQELCEVIGPLLRDRKTRHGIDPVVKILTALNFYAGGGYQRRVGKNDDAPMAQQSVSRCINEVTTALNAPQVLAKYIKFPRTQQERAALKLKFYNQHGIPGVIGCIDCTHIAIVRPTQFEERFFNRKHYHSLNVQMICDSDNYILNVDASYGGASHDSFIWGNSNIKSHMESLTRQGETAYFLGDSGYPLREYLITPFLSCEAGSQEDNFNKAHKRTRSTIERTFGILKGRFRCLLNARELYYCPETAGKITIACCVLHNMCTREAVDFIRLTPSEIDRENVRIPNILPPPANASQLLQQGRITRNNIVQIFRTSNI